MKIHHKRHLSGGGTTSKMHVGSFPSHIAHGGTATHTAHGANVSRPKNRKPRAKGGRAGLPDGVGPHSKEPVNDELYGKADEGQYKAHEPDVVYGNPNVIREAEEKKALGEVPGIYAKSRLDRRARGGRTHHHDGHHDGDDGPRHHGKHHKHHDG